ncbi:MAG: DUF2182 domain-containing protein [Gemmatimonadaceae bacterium]
MRAAAALEWRPEWRITVVVALAWAALLAGVGRRGDVAGHARRDLAAVVSPAHDDRHDLSHPSSAAGPAHGTRHGSGGPLTALADWALMAVAMMAPATLPAVRHVGLNSIRRRRQWAMTLYFAVFLGVWVIFGALALAGERAARQTLGLNGRILLALALAAAGGWQLTRVKRRALFRCGRTVPLPPVGLRADAGCARFALQQGRQCVTSCWALMLVMTIIGHSDLSWMTGLTALIVVEKLTRFGRHLRRPSATLLAVAAGLVALGA